MPLSLLAPEETRSRRSSDKWAGTEREIRDEILPRNFGGGPELHLVEKTDHGARDENPFSTRYLHSAIILTADARAFIL